MDSTKKAFQRLFEETIQRVERDGCEQGMFARAIAYYDKQRDEFLKGASAFEAAVAAASSVREVRTKYGLQNTERLVLQFIYNCLGKNQTAEANVAFDDTWFAFSEELRKDTWTNSALAHLQNLECSVDSADIADGVAIQPRTPRIYEEVLGWGDERVAKIDGEEYSQSLASHVMVASYEIEKKPQNFVSQDSFTVSNKAMRALLALRIADAGEVCLGRMFYSRPSSFDVGIGWTSSSGHTVWRPGRHYTLSTATLERTRKAYAHLHGFEEKHREKWGNVDVALGAFSSSYEHDSYHGRGNRLLDCITGLEALLGSSSELRFKLAFRVAGILAADDEQRVELYERVSDFYHTRSRIVHGGALKPKERETANDVPALRQIVRRLVMAFLTLIPQERFASPKKFKEKVDCILLHTEHRNELRRAMGLA